MFDAGFSALAGSSLLRWRLAAGAILLALIYVGFRARADVAERMGFTDADVALLTVGGLAAPVLSVPVAVVDGSVFAVNLGGALVPLILAWRLYHRGHLPLARTLVGAVPVAVATWWVVDVQAGVGVVARFPGFLAPPLAALTVGLLAGGVRPDRAGPIALGAGSLGALVGADLVALPEVLELARAAPPGSALVVGGGGSFDLVFLSGAIGLGLSLALTLIATQAPTPRLGSVRGRPVRIPQPRRLLQRADQLPGLTPRERALVSLARANLALELQRPVRALREARQAVDALLTSGSPRLLDRVRRGQGDPALIRELGDLDSDRSGEEVDWLQASETVEVAKHTMGRLWRHAPGRVRLRGWSA